MHEHSGSMHKLLQQSRNQQRIRICCINKSVDILNDYSKNMFYFPNQFCPTINAKLRSRIKHSTRDVLINVPIHIPLIPSKRRLCRGISYANNHKYTHKNNVIPFLQKHREFTQLLDRNKSYLE